MIAFGEGGPKLISIRNVVLKVLTAGDTEVVGLLRLGSKEHEGGHAAQPHPPSRCEQIFGLRRR